MTNWSVLVIDDEARPDGNDAGRYTNYRKLESQTYEERGFALTFATSPDGARTMLNKGSFDLVLLDVRLERWGDGESCILFKEFLTLANRRSTVGLVSNRWNDTSTPVVRDFLLSAPDVRLPLFFTFDDFERGAAPIIATQIVAHLRRHRRAHNLELPPNAPIRILHLSDLHFGSKEAERTLAGFAKTNLLCDRIKSEWPEDPGNSPAGPHIIAVTGDIANTGHPSEYTDALRWFTALAKEFGWALPTPRILLVPGNHDFSIPLCGAQSLFLQEDGKLRLKGSVAVRPELSAYAMRPFAEFATSVSRVCHAWDTSPLGYWTEFGYAEYGIVFSGFNTSKKADQNSRPLPHVDIEDIALVKERIRSGIWAPASHLLHVSMSHHSPLPHVASIQPIGNHREYQEQFLDVGSLRPRLLLHGHDHSRQGTLPSGNDYFVISAPTPTKNTASDADGSPKGANLITLFREDGVVKRIVAKSLVRLDNKWTVVDLAGKSQFEVAG